MKSMTFILDLNFFDLKIIKSVATKLTNYLEYHY